MKCLKEKIIECAKDLHAQGWLAACDGNISCKIDGEIICITPRQRPKRHLFIEELCSIDQNGKDLEVGKSASSEKSMHLAVYKSASKAKAVVHAHPPYAIAFSLAFPDEKSLFSESLSEVILAVGSIPVVPYARPGTSSMGAVLQEYLPEHRVLVLSQHGALSWGESIEEAYSGIERLEHSAKTLYLAHTWALAREMEFKIKRLSQSETEFLKESRVKLGEKIL